MSPQLQTQYIGKARRHPTKVWFSGSTALRKGIGVCYDYDYQDPTDGAATDKEERRRTYVELPSSTNAMYFAGVTAHSYSAVTGGQMIEIYEPGSVCEIATMQDVTLGDMVTCKAGGQDAGVFGLSGFRGKGSALAMQTKDMVSTAETDGTGSVNATTFTGVGFTAADVGKTLVIYAIEDGGTVGEYTISAYTNATTVTISSSASAAAKKCNYYVRDGNPTVLAELMDGDQSGLMEWVVPVDDDAADCMETGVTNIFGGHTIGTGDSTATLAQGTWPGQRKKLECHGAITTNDYLVSLATTGFQRACVSLTATTMNNIDLVSMEFDADGEKIVLQFDEVWREEYSTGVTLASS